MNDTQKSICFVIIIYHVAMYISLSIPQAEIASPSTEPAYQINRYLDFRMTILAIFLCYMKADQAAETTGGLSFFDKRRKHIKTKYGYPLVESR